MPQPLPRVSLAVCGIFHYRKYIGELSTRGCLTDFFYSHRLGTTAASLGIRSGRARNLWAKEYLYRAALRFTGGQLPGWFELALHPYWDRAVARRLRGCDLFHAMLHGTLPHSLRRARSLGMVTLGEPVNTHPEVLHDLLRTEHEFLGLPPPPPPTATPLLEEATACDFLVAGSRLIRDSFVARGFPSDRAFVIPYAFDTTRFHPLSPDERAAVRDHRFRVLCVAQIIPRKGIHYLLEAWTRLGIPAQEGELVLIGQPIPEMAAVLSRYAGRFTHIPAVPHERLRLEYGRADVFVLPSVEDGFGLVTTEAMGCGLPVITTTGAGSADVVEDGVSGFVVEPRSVDPLADRLERLRADPELRRKMGERGLSASRGRLTWTGYVDALTDLYRRLGPMVD
ncbi:MAG: glycosyltransferase family 4 protein [Pirellulales bacterium]|jgi:glycosyltransferase involved in cell wall biosynthesis